MKLQPSSLLLQYSPGFVSFVHQGEGGSGNLQTPLLLESHDSFKALQGVPGAAGKLRDAPCPHTATSGWARTLEFGIPKPRDRLGTSRHRESPAGICWEGSAKAAGTQLGMAGTEIGVARGEAKVSLPTSAAGVIPSQ